MHKPPAVADSLSPSELDRPEIIGAVDLGSNSFHMIVGELRHGQLAILDDGQIFSCDLTPHGKARKIFTMREPVRAISAITPFNHPLNMVSHKIAPSIATNNCMVCKPTEQTPLTALRIGELLHRAGVPDGVVNIVPTLDSGAWFDAAVDHPSTRMVSFTGSTATGRVRSLTGNG